MASVTFLTSAGGDGSTVTDDDNITTGLANGGYLLRYVPMVSQVVTVSAFAATQASNAATSATTATTQASAAAASAAQAAQQANTLTATSTTSTLIGTGSKIFTTQSGEQFITGQFVTIADSVTPTNYMYGQVTSYSTTQLTVSVTSIGGSGTLASWNISLSGIKGDTGPLGSPIELGTTGANVNVGNSAPPTAGQLLTATSSTAAIWQDAPVSLPSQTGNTGKLLTTDGTIATWQNAPRSTPDFLLINAGIR